MHDGEAFAAVTAQVFRVLAVASSDVRLQRVVVHELLPADVAFEPSHSVHPVDVHSNVHSRFENFRADRAFRLHRLFRLLRLLAGFDATFRSYLRPVTASHVPQQIFPNVTEVPAQVAS